MNRSSNNGSYIRESLAAGRNIPAALQLRRGQNLNGFSKDVSDESHLDLFSKTRRTVSVASSPDDSADVSVKLGRLAVGSAKVARGGIDDLLSATDGGKHDYDWLLTPPGTPLFPSSDGRESQPKPVAPRSSSLVRSASNTKTSRLSVSQSESNHLSRPGRSSSESNHSTRPARSSSVTRPSISASQYSTYSSNRSSSILNTSSTSVSSYIRPSSPSTRSTSSARPSTPSSRPTVSRSSTPSRTRPSLTSSSTDRARPSQNSRSSTPSSRPQISASLNSTSARPNSRPSTPTRRIPVTSTPSVAPSLSSARGLSNGRNHGPASRPSSPSPRVRAPQQPIVPPDFPLDTPPNLRTTLPDRPISAGRSRPGASVTKNSEATGSATIQRRHSSPIVTRGRLTEPPGRGRALANGHTAETPESRRASHVPELSSRRHVKSSSTTESTGFGRSISKKSLDMAIRHMDIRNGGGSIRGLPGTTLFPQSVRSATSKTHSRGSESVSSNGSLQNGEFPEKGNNISNGRSAENGSDANEGPYLQSAKLSEVDIYESSRYDTILLKEDLKNTNWLHSIDDKFDQGFFENGLEHLPEPFGPL